MINKDAYKAAWRTLLTRFGKQWDAGQAAAYYEYLSPQQTTEQFQAAARSLWATATFFPRPADFLLTGISTEWGLVLKCMEGYHAPDWPWREPWLKLTERGRNACRAIGGIEAIKQEYERSPLRIKQAWETAYEQTTASDALALPSGSSAPQLKAVQ